MLRRYLTSAMTLTTLLSPAISFALQPIAEPPATTADQAIVTQQTEPQPTPPGPVTIQFAPGHFGSGMTAPFVQPFQPPQLLAEGDFMIGLECEQIPVHYRKLLKLPADAGLLVRRVLPKHPADKAGIIENDIILRINKQSLSSVAELVNTLQKVGEAETSIVIWRDGAEKTLAVTPIKRKQSANGMTGEKIRQRLQNEFTGQGFRWESLPMVQGHIEAFDVIRPAPGVIVGSAGAVTELPDNVRVQITKQGKDPAKIEIRRGEEKFSTTEDKLDQLPDDVRQLVEPLLQKQAIFSAGSIHSGMIQALPPPVSGSAAGTVIGPPPMQPPMIHVQPIPHMNAEQMLRQMQTNQQEQLQAIQKQLKEMQEQIQGLQKVQKAE